MSTISASTTSTTAFKVTSDTTGALVFQTGASPTTAMTLSSAQIVSFTNPPTATGAGSVATNTAYGTSALAANTTGAYQTAIGRLALALNTSGDRNTGVGYGALETNTTGSYNVAMGFGALDSNTTASNNTAVGYQAGYSNTTGASVTAFGYQAGKATVSVNSSTYIGSNSGLATTGAQNTFLGQGSGEAITSGAKNTVIGRYDGNTGGFDMRTESNWIVLSDGDGNPRLYGNGGNTWYMNSSSGQRYVWLQFNIATTAKSSIYWDNTNTALYVQNSSGGVYLTNTGTSWTSNSDERLKENLTPIENGLSKVCSLRSVIGNFIADETKKPTPFLIAQDVQAVLPEAVTTSTIRGDETNTEYLGVAYTEVIPLLVAAIKELKAELDTAKAEIATLKGAA